MSVPTSHSHFSYPLPYPLPYPLSYPLWIEHTSLTRLRGSDSYVMFMPPCHNPHGSTMTLCNFCHHEYPFWLICMVAINGLSPANLHCTLGVNLSDHLVWSLWEWSPSSSNVFSLDWWVGSLVVWILTSEARPRTHRQWTQVNCHCNIIMFNLMHTTAVPPTMSTSKPLRRSTLQRTLHHY